jgi:hypothetical protein
MPCGVLAQDIAAAEAEKVDGPCLRDRLMQRFLIETPHNELNCKLLLSQVETMGYLHSFDWGCEAGVHSGWAIIEAESEAEARLAVPSVVRHEARVIPIIKYSSEQARKKHQE